jgi:hypothetical protein
MLTWRSPTEKPMRALSTDEARATFELENVGGTPVRILGVETSCGCATPEIGSKTIPPGKVGIVEVRATPLQIGERMAFITIQTDSPSSPNIVLRLHIVGSRRPPFMAQARGELNYIGDVPVGDLGKIYAYNMELAGSAPRPPLVKSDVSFVEIGPAKLLEEQPYDGPDVVSRKYVFDARVVRDPSVDKFAGTIVLIDPWDPEHVERTRFHGEGVTDD